jgi:hypothetical protein
VVGQHLADFVLRHRVVEAREAETLANEPVVQVEPRAVGADDQIAHDAPVDIADVARLADTGEHFTGDSILTEGGEVLPKRMGARLGQVLTEPAVLPRRALDG